MPGFVSCFFTHGLTDCIHTHAGGALSAAAPRPVSNTAFTRSPPLQLAGENRIPLLSLPMLFMLAGGVPSLGAKPL